MLSDQNSPETSRTERLKISLREIGPALGSLAVILVIIAGVVYLVWQTKDNDPVIPVGKDELELVRDKAVTADQATPASGAQQQTIQDRQNIQSQPNIPENNPAASDTQPSAEETSKQLVDGKLNSIDSQFSGLSSSQLKTDDISDSALGL